MFTAQLRSTMPTGNIPEAPELWTPRLLNILYAKAEVTSEYHFLSNTYLVLNKSLNRKIPFVLGASQFPQETAAKFSAIH